MLKCAVGYSLGGNLAQYILIQEEVLKGECLLPLPDADMAYFAVSMAEPISCIYSAQERNYHIIKMVHTPIASAAAWFFARRCCGSDRGGAMGRMHAELALRFKPAVLIVSDLQQSRLDETMQTIGKKAAAKGVKLLCALPDKLADTVKAESRRPRC